MTNDKIELGDIVSMGWDDGYNVATVSQVHKDGTVDLFRPFTHTGDFSHTGRHTGSVAVSCYVGIEEVKGVRGDILRVLRKGKALR